MWRRASPGAGTQLDGGVSIMAAGCRLRPRPDATAADSHRAAGFTAENGHSFTRVSTDTVLQSEAAELTC